METPGNTDVYILCGGKGKRLRKISGNTPKPLMKLGNKAFLDILIGSLVKQGFRRIILGIGYNPGFFERHYRKNNPGAEIILIKEKTPLGTGGALKLARERIKSRNFFVLNGDSFCRFNAGKVLSFHAEKKSLATVLLRKVEAGFDYGKIEIDKKGKIIGFSEKNTNAKNCLVNAGVYLFNKEIYSLMPRKNRFSIEYDFFPKLVGKNFFGYPLSGIFIDIGTPERFKAAERLFKRKS